MKYSIFTVGGKWLDNNEREVDSMEKRKTGSL